MSLPIYLKEIQGLHHRYLPTLAPVASPGDGRRRFMSCDRRRPYGRRMPDTRRDRPTSLQLEVLLEVHSEDELKYLNADIDMLGVNNRNLGTFHTDVNNSFKLVDKMRGFSQPNPFLFGKVRD